MELRPSFNSLLVRLEEYCAIHSSIRLQKFQFLIGAIGSCLLLRMQVFGFLVSIPYWCDWKK